MRGGIHRCRVRKPPGTSKEESTHAYTYTRTPMFSCKCSDKFRLPSCLNLSGPILMSVVVSSVNHWATFFAEKQQNFFLIWKKKWEEIVNNLWHLVQYSGGIYVILRRMARQTTAFLLRNSTVFFIYFFE